ncbi:hypothetical protein C0J52_22220 [Blattella germanica]|nr:hypothetical protein C0J52_22220 [Blattella germanica]
MKRNKVHKFQNMCGTIKRTLKNKTQKETMLKFYKTMAVPIFTYGSENWPMNREDRRTIETAEIKFLRYLAGYYLTDRMRSDYIRDQLNVYNLNDKIRNSKQNWHDHILRMPNNRQAKQAMQYKPLGARDIAIQFQFGLTHLEREGGENRVKVIMLYGAVTSLLLAFCMLEDEWKVCPLKKCYFCALNIMTEKKFFMLKKSALENWQHLEHPVYLLQAKPSDIELIRQVVPNADISSAHIGYTIDEANNSKKVLNLLKGVPKKMSTQSESSTDKKKKKGDSKDKIKSKDSKLKKDTSKSASDTGGCIESHPRPTTMEENIKSISEILADLKKGQDRMSGEMTKMSAAMERRITSVENIVKDVKVELENTMEKCRRLDRANARWEHESSNVGYEILRKCISKRVDLDRVTSKTYLILKGPCFCGELLKAYGADQRLRTASCRLSSVALEGNSLETSSSLAVHHMKLQGALDHISLPHQREKNYSRTSTKDRPITLKITSAIESVVERVGKNSQIKQNAELIWFALVFVSKRELARSLMKQTSGHLIIRNAAQHSILNALDRCVYLH